MGNWQRNFPQGWLPQHKQLLYVVMGENRRYQKIRTPRLLQQLELDPITQSCDSELSRITGGLVFEEMMRMAEAAKFRQTLAYIGESVGKFLFSSCSKR